MSTTITLSLSPFLFSRMDRSIRSCPLVTGEAKKICELALNIVGNLVPDSMDENEWSDIEVPAEAAHAFLRSIVLMSFFAAQISPQGKEDEVSQLIMESAFIVSPEYARAALENMVDACENPNKPFSILAVLTHNKNKENYENN